MKSLAAKSALRGREPARGLAPPVGQRRAGREEPGQVAERAIAQVGIRGGRERGRLVTGAAAAGQHGVGVTERRHG